MLYPTLNEQATSRQMVDTFRGYNHNLRIADGEFYDMRNMTSDYYPVLSPRGKRGSHPTAGSVDGLIAKDALCYVEDGKFIINGNEVPGFRLTEGEKTLISMGAYVIVMPDKKYINTEDLTEFGNIEASVTTSNPVKFTLSRMDASEYPVDYIQATEPTDPANMALWIDTSTTPHSLKQWSDTNGMWVSIATTYVKIESEGIGQAFDQYDGITISGLDAVEDQQIKDLNGSAIVYSKGEDFIVVVGILDTERTISTEVTISRTMPNMDFIIERENRLWGCRYGQALNGEIVNEIYASVLGDFKNWNRFMGISTDSYVASVGTDGPFTGAITHLGYPLFFKENCVHKVYGNFPANFQIQDTTLRGVQKGCDKSLAIVNEVLYYKARHAVCAYDGSLPTEVSYVMGDKRYSDAVGVAHGNKYYISMRDNEGYHLFVYDTSKGMWHREDNFQAVHFCSCGDELYAVDETGAIVTMLGSGEPTEEQVEWMVETGELMLSSPDMKYISRLTVRMSLDIGASVEFYAQYDLSDEWIPIATMHGTSLRSFSVPIRPRRCDHMKLRIVGAGNGKIYSITKTIEQGSELS